MNSDSLSEFEKVESQKNFPFAKNTTYACGGTAEIAYFPTTINQAKAVYDYLKETGKRYVTLGNGSNVLASDNGFDGAVVCTKKLSGIINKGGGRLFCLSGTKVSKLLKYCIDNGLGGLEYLAGIPATIGGIALMNGGAGGTYIENNIESVMLYNGSICNFSNKNCKFGYKYSIMRDINAIILGVELAVYAKDGHIVRENVSRYMNKRLGQPRGASCGCVFKNPASVSAGKLIEDAGLKGLCFGGAQVSFEHANFIINRGGRAFDVYTLIKSVKQKVFERTGILLEEEVVYIGDF